MNYYIFKTSNDVIIIIKELSLLAAKSFLDEPAELVEVVNETTTVIYRSDT